jgi:hypothetical protein
MRKMQCYTEYIQGCTQYKITTTNQFIQIHYFISIDETCISGYIRIWVYTHMSKYKIVYTLMNAVYLPTSQYIRVYTRM